MDSKVMMEAAKAMLPDMIRLRREFHKYAECGWLEMRTSSRIAGELKAMGYDPVVGENVCRVESRMGLPADGELKQHYEWAKGNGADLEFLPLTAGGRTGVIAELDCGPGPVIVLRFDIDALGVEEQMHQGHRPYDEGWASVTPGVMHSCGHDGHAAIGTALAKLLMAKKNEICGKIRLIFQPAEEGVRGAKSIVDAGWLDDVDYVFATHIFPHGTSEAEVALIKGGGSYGLATVKYDFTFHGQAAHAGANPQEGKNAMLAAATSVLNFHAIPRYGKTPTHINVGRLEAGSERNVVCDRAFLQIEVRGATEEAVSYMENRALQIAKSSAEMYDCSLEIQRMGSAPSMVCDPELTDFVAQIVTDELGFPLYLGEPYGGGSEDFAYFTRKAEGRGGKSLFIGLPCCCKAPNHDPKFDFDEDAMVHGLAVLFGTISKLSEKSKTK